MPPGSKGSSGPIFVGEGGWSAVDARDKAHTASICEEKATTCIATHQRTKGELHGGTSAPHIYLPDLAKATQRNPRSPHQSQRRRKGTAFWPEPVEERSSTRGTQGGPGDHRPGLDPDGTPSPGRP